MKKLSTTLFALIALVSCSKVKELESRTENMDNNTSEMRNLTEDMSATTGDMSETTDQMLEVTLKLKELTAQMHKSMLEMIQTTSAMNSTTNFMHPQLRTKESEDTRTKKMAKLLSEDASVGEKLVSAVVFMQGFEYQYWTFNNTYDTLDTRDYLLYDAVNEFFGRMLDIWEEIDVKDASPIKKNPNKHNLVMAWNSLAHALHYKHYIQMNLYKQKGGFEELSMYDIIINAFTKEKNGEPLRPYEDLVLSNINRDIAEDILNARINMMAGLALNFGAQSDKKLSAGRKIQAGWFFVTGKKGGKIQLKSLFEKSSDSTKRYVLGYLKHAVQTKSDMKAAGLRPNMDPIIDNVLNNLVMYYTYAKSDPLSAEYHTLIKELRKLYSY